MDGRCALNGDMQRESKPSLSTSGFANNFSNKTVNDVRTDNYFHHSITPDAQSRDPRLRKRSRAVLSNDVASTSAQVTNQTMMMNDDTNHCEMMILDDDSDLSSPCSLGSLDSDDEIIKNVHDKNVSSINEQVAVIRVTTKHTTSQCNDFNGVKGGLKSVSHNASTKVNLSLKDELEKAKRIREQTFKGNGLKKKSKKRHSANIVKREVQQLLHDSDAANGVKRSSSSNSSVESVRSTSSSSSPPQSNNNRARISRQRKQTLTRTVNKRQSRSSSQSLSPQPNTKLAEIIMGQKKQHKGGYITSNKSDTTRKFNQFKPLHYRYGFGLKGRSVLNGTARFNRQAQFKGNNVNGMHARNDVAAGHNRFNRYHNNHQNIRPENGYCNGYSGKRNEPCVSLNSQNQRKKVVNQFLLSLEKEVTVLPEIVIDVKEEESTIEFIEKIKQEQKEKSDGEVSSDDDDDLSIKSCDFEDVASDISLTEEEDDECTELTMSNYWSQYSRAKLYYKLDPTAKLNGSLRTTEKQQQLQSEFYKKIIYRNKSSIKPFPQYDPPALSELMHRFRCKHSHDKDGQSSSSCSDSDSEHEDSMQNERLRLQQDEMQRKLNHPCRLHSDIWFNEHHQLNDGPVCRCSYKARQTGIRHFIFPGESRIPCCDLQSNNPKLFHYRVIISPIRNFKITTSTNIIHDDHSYTFEGFSLFTHEPIHDKLSVCRVVRYNTEYTISYCQEETPENVSIKDLNLFYEYLFDQILELHDLNLRARGVDDGCQAFHVMPRFVRALPENGKELLSMNVVMSYLLEQCKLLIPRGDPSRISHIDDVMWNNLVDDLRGQIVMNPTKKPTSIRIDHFDRSRATNPTIVHFGVKPSMLTYSGNPQYQKAWKQYVKFRHLLNNKPKVTTEDKQKLALKEYYLQKLRTKAALKRDITAEISAIGFYRTGIYADVAQHALMLPVLFQHLRFQWSLQYLQTERLKYTFKARGVLQLALTHPSYRANYGMNPDHARNSMTNCGMRQPEYGSGKLQHMHSRKRGINTLIDIMARMGSKRAKKSRITNNERLEFLGDAVIEFLTSVHLYFMFPDLQEGGLATYRSAIVQNKQLAELAKIIGLDEFMLYAHGPDLCHDADLKHAMANCFEAIMAALYLDGGLDVIDRVFSESLFPDSSYFDVWMKLDAHPLQSEDPAGDWHMIPHVPVLQKLNCLQDGTGLYFKNIRILARAFTRRNVGFNFLTLGHNQRLEFLGDTVLQLITSTYLYRHFPEHHEGHLSLLRSCLVNNKTQSVICEDLGLIEFVIDPPTLQEHKKQKQSQQLRMKDKADLVESLIGALFVDRGLLACKVFCRVCFFPRLKYFIMTQKWNDSKSQLQQCCLTLRSPHGGEPDIPQYKVIEAHGPTNTRTYTVAVYFRSQRLATGSGRSVQEAEMKSADLALKKCKDLFPHLERQRDMIERRFKFLPQTLFTPSGYPKKQLIKNKMTKQT